MFMENAVKSQPFRAWILEDKPFDHLGGMLEFHDSEDGALKRVDLNVSKAPNVTGVIRALVALEHEAKKRPEYDPDCTDEVVICSP